MSHSGKESTLKELKRKVRRKFRFLQLSTLSKGHSDNIVMPEIKNNHAGQGRWKILATTENGEILDGKDPERGSPYSIYPHL